MLWLRLGTSINVAPNNVDQRSELTYTHITTHMHMQDMHTCMCILNIPKPSAKFDCYTRRFSKCLFWCGSQSISFLNEHSCLCQAPVAKKKATKAPKGASEEVVPMSMKERVMDALGDLLKESGTARTSAITLGGLEYADNLSNAIKQHADKVEVLYSKVRGSLKKSPGDKEMNQFLKDIEAHSQSTKKLQARPAVSTCS